jgi:hypothetical protein
MSHLPCVTLTRGSRFIHCPRLKDSDEEINLKPLKNLQILRLDENFLGRDLEYDTARLINTFVNPPAHLSEVHVNGVAQPNPSVIFAIQRFSNLRILRLRQTRTWCDLCNLGCLLALAAPLPKSIVYENGAGLSVRGTGILSPSILSYPSRSRSITWKPCLHWNDWSSCQ